MGLLIHEPRPIGVNDTYRHPRTGTVWNFPKDAGRYLGLTEARRRGLNEALCCEEGHFDCAAWERGPCSDMVWSVYVYPNAEEAQARAQENADLDQEEQR